MLGWATSDSPWAHIVDRERFSQVLDRVRQLQPTQSYRIRDRMGPEP
jgi:hypothetical protein